MASCNKFLLIRTLPLQKLSPKIVPIYCTRQLAISSSKFSGFNNYKPYLHSSSSAPIKWGLLSQKELLQSKQLCRQYSSYPSHTVVHLPALSPTMETGSVVSWAKNEGDRIDEGDLLAEIETDKATMSLDASDSGYIAKILFKAGSKDIPVGMDLLVIVEDEGDVAAFKDFTPSATPSSPPEPAAAPEAPPVAPSPAPKPASVAAPVAPAAPVLAPPAATAGRAIASPLARTLAKDAGLDLNSVNIQGSGPEGRITADDVRAALAGGITSGSPAAMPMMTTAMPAGASFVDVPLSSMRAVIAKRLTESKRSIPHYQLTVEINMNRILEARESMNKQLAASKRKLSVNDFVLKATAIACKRIPEANSAWNESFIRQYNSVDLCVAVATPNGLITPIVFSAEAKGLLEINDDVLRLANKAKENKLQPHEFQGGTFTVSNLGMFGISSFSAIINPPQACILAVGGGEKRMIPDDSSPEGMTVATIMAVTLCPDHRVVDGAIGAKWLAEFKQLMENPYSMLL